MDHANVREINSVYAELCHYESTFSRFDVNKSDELFSDFLWDQK